MKEVKCVVVGDRETGKYSLITACTVDALPGSNIKTTKETLSKVVNTRDGDVTINFRYDSRMGSGDMDIFREPLYKDVDVVIICFSIADPLTFKSVITRWKIKSREQSKSVPIVLVATKLDLRDDPETIRELKEKKLTPVSHDQGAAMAREINARAYIECSALTRINIGVVRNKTVKAALMRRSGLCSLF